LFNVKAGLRTAHQQLGFINEAWRIRRRHRLQTLETVAELKRKYEMPVNGHVRVWDLLGRLAQCVDPTDTSLYGMSQQVHVLQVLEAMERDGVDDPDMLLAALVHDVGKLLLLEDEEPENVACMNGPIGQYPRGAGLDRCVLQWNHDEFAYSRLRGIVPDHIAWLIRYHSISVRQCEHLMNECDREWTKRYLLPFQRYDQGSKSAFRVPGKTLAEYRELIESRFPKPILY
jgi:hypothetical protein